MRVIGFDPSNTGAAFAVLDVAGGSRVFVGRGDVEAWAVGKLLRDMNKPDLIAIERPHGVNMHPRPQASMRELHQMIAMARSVGTALMGASYVVGRISGVAEEMMIRTIELSASRWRGMLGVARRTKDTSQDDLIRDAVQSLISDWPKKSNSHVRDAAGVGLVAAWMMAADGRAIR